MPQVEGQFVGKTYSLRPTSTSSDDYYQAVGQLTDRLLRLHPDPRSLLQGIRAASKKKNPPQNLHQLDESTGQSGISDMLRSELSRFTTAVGSHLHSLRVFDRWDRTLATSEWQYHCYMIEIELVNRIYAAEFRSCATKYAFLPHCLRDLEATCRSARRDVDYVCKGCSDRCGVNDVSKMLRLHGVKPYIWMTADLKGIFRKMKKEGDNLGVLGVACIPELVRGMRLCLTHEIPVAGIPLDANRCARWWGEFYPNTVNLSKLESIISEAVPRTA